MPLARCRPIIERYLPRRQRTAPRPPSANSDRSPNAPTTRHLRLSTSGQLAGLVAPGTNITFSHELIREAVGGWLSAADRIRVHRDAITALSGGPVQQLPLAAAHAIALAGVDPAYTSAAIELSLAAAQFFESVGSLEAALDAYDEAARLGELSGAALPIDRQLAHADAALGAGRLTRARELYQRVATASELSGDAIELADAAAGLGGIWLGEHRSDDVAAGVRALQERALEAVTPVDTGRALRLRVRLAGEASYQSREVDRTRTAPRRGPRVWHRTNARRGAVDHDSCQAWASIRSAPLGVGRRDDSGRSRVGRPGAGAPCTVLEGRVTRHDRRRSGAARASNTRAALPDHSLRKHPVHRRSNGGRTADQCGSIRRGRSRGGRVFRVRPGGWRCRRVDLLRRAPCAHPVLTGPPRRARRVRHGRRTVPGDAARASGPLRPPPRCSRSTSASGARPIASSHSTAHHPT